MLTVINKRHQNRNIDRRRVIYAGRPGPLGNPFVVGRDGVRGECCDKFERWFLGDTDGAIEARRFASTLPDDAILECWCVPARCHAQIIADFENTRRGFI